MTAGVPLLLLWTAACVIVVEGFVIVPRIPLVTRERTWRQADSTSNDRSNIPTNRKNSFSIRDLQERIERQPDKYSKVLATSSTKTKKKYHRTRRRVQNPQQHYVYKRQRRPNTNDSINDLDLARELGLYPTMQHCDPLPGEEPILMGRVRVACEQEAYAYLIDKPAGWSVLGGKVKKEKEPTVTPKAKKKLKRIRDEEDDILEYSELDIRGVLTPQELKMYEKEMGSALSHTSTPASHRNTTFQQALRPSVVNWLKDHLYHSLGSTIRGGTFWSALAGAVEVEDSGLLLLCPRAQTDLVVIESAEYVVVTGCGRSIQKTKKCNKPQQGIKIEALSHRGAPDDSIRTVLVVVSDSDSTCSTAVNACSEPIRGDPTASPFDRRAQRRLAHCQALTVSSVYAMSKSTTRSEASSLPDDLLVWMHGDKPDFDETTGSFPGRTRLYHNPHTTAYREINGAADGYPGWVVDRYDKWLLVQHDSEHPMGPLPTINDTSTAGIYYMMTTYPDKNYTNKPRLCQGSPAPTLFPVLENGIRYMVSMDHISSTGLFLDQRPQREWLANHCTSSTTLLNVFCHTGAFSVAAAIGTSTTVNIDVSRNWLERFSEHLAANGIEYSKQQHDCIYGDSLDWLQRLVKRGGQYDIVILDPPSSSIFNKKRWSIKQDMTELVQVASALVKPGGRLWTSTNCASLPVLRLARLCQKGLQEKKYQLERIQPMPSDYPSFGPQPVKNLVWRIY